jgi:hypothetical protein
VARATGTSDMLDMLARRLSHFEELVASYERERADAIAGAARRPQNNHFRFLVLSVALACWNSPLKWRKMSRDRSAPSLTVSYLDDRPASRRQLEK